MNISVIIPCYNDGSKLKSIVKQIQKSRLVKEVIVVDDGSNIETKNEISKIGKITLVTHLSNLGKTQALLSGVKIATGEMVLFVDADLRNFSDTHIEKMYEELDKGKLDLVLGFREKEIFYMNWIGFAQAYSGERMMKRSLLMKHKSMFDVENYLIEPEINKICFHNYKVGGVVLKNLAQTYKLQKTGVAGLLKDLKMYVNYLRHLRLSELMYQLKFVRGLYAQAKSKYE